MRFQRFAGVCGLIAPIVGQGLVFMAVIASPWFSWQQNDLSDLGISATPNTFNSGLVVGGLFNLLFALGFYRWNGPGKRARLGSSLLLLGTIGLTLIGLINETYRPWHRLIASSYFLFTPLAYLFIGAQAVNPGEKTARRTTLAAGLVALLVIGSRAALTHDAGIAVPEILASFIMSSWTFSMGMKLLFEPGLDCERP